MKQKNLDIYREYANDNQSEYFNLDLSPSHKMGYVLYASIADFNSKETGLSKPLLNEYSEAYLKALYDEFKEEDKKLASEGILDYQKMLDSEDH